MRGTPYLVARVLACRRSRSTARGMACGGPRYPADAGCRPRGDRVGRVGCGRGRRVAGRECAAGRAALGSLLAVRKAVFPLRQRGWPAPLAGPGAKFTRAAEDQAAWLAAHMTGSRVAELLRITWRSVQAIVIRALRRSSRGWVVPGEAEQVVAFVEGQMQTLRDRGEHLLGRVRSALPLEPAVVVGGDVAERGDFFAAKTGGSAALPTREADVFRLERLSLGLGLAAHLAAGAEVVMPVRNLARARGGREDQAATTWGISLSSPTCCPYCARDARATSQISVAANQHAINWNDLNRERPTTAAARTASPRSRSACSDSNWTGAAGREAGESPATCGIALRTLVQPGLDDVSAPVRVGGMAPVKGRPAGAAPPTPPARRR